MAAIHFFSEDVDFVPKYKMNLRVWIKHTAEAEGYAVGELNFIFCSDAYLLTVNQEFLQHDTFTDIVTFDHSERAGRLAGDIFISIDRVKENASTFNVREVDELHRVIIHGVLHLCGYGDKTQKEKTAMTVKEDHYLARRQFDVQ